MKRVVLAAGLMVLSSGVAMAAAPIDGSGTVGTCVVSGSIKIKPALKNGNVGPAALKAKAKGKETCSGGTGDGANVISIKAKGTATTTTSDCSGLAGTTPSTLVLTVKWKVAPGTQKVNPSTVTFTSQTGGVTGDNHGQFDLSGTVTGGSFNGNPVTAHIETDQLVLDLLNECGDKGIKKITFGLNGLSNTQL